MKKLISAVMVIVLLASMSATVFATNATSITFWDEEQWTRVGGRPDNVKEIIPKDATVTWSSSNPKVATVDSNGRATAVGVGTTTITAKSGSLKASYKLEVRPEAIVPPTDPKVLEAAKNPGLGVRGLHKQGLTGKGVNIAYVGSGILDSDVSKFTHSEFSGKITGYKDLGWNSRERLMGRGNSESSYKMTFNNVYKAISAVVGKTVGTAPDANIYMVGVYGLPATTAGINHIVERNKSLSKADQVRIIVMETYGGSFTDDDVLKAYYAAVNNAEKSGILVLQRDYIFGYDKYNPNQIYVAGLGAYYNTNSPDDVSKATTNIAEQYDFQDTKNRSIFAPNARRTVAVNDNSYEYFSSDRGNFTQNAYLAGVVAMGLQANPNLTVPQIKKALMDTKDKNNHMVNPPAFIEAVKKAK